MGIIYLYLTINKRVKKILIVRFKQTVIARLKKTFIKVTLTITQKTTSIIIVLRQKKTFLIKVKYYCI